MLERIKSHWVDFALLPDRPVMLNVGAGCGDFALDLLNRTNGTIVCVEPFAEENGLRPFSRHCQVRRVAVDLDGGHGTGWLMFNFYPQHMASTSVTHRLAPITKDGCRSVVRPAIALEDLLAEFAEIDYANFDLEGAEWELFESIDPALLCKIHQFSIQFHTDVAGENWSTRLAAIVVRLADTWNAAHMSDHNDFWCYSEAWFGPRG
jgi:hypothetical protein